MKNLVKAVAVILAALASTFSQPSFAAFKHNPVHTPVKSCTAESSFSVELKAQPNREVIFLTIKNPGRKNLSVTLNAPDDFTIDNFCTGKKHDQLDKTYNFSEADEGVYTIVVSDGVQTIKKQIKLEHIIVRSVSRLTVQ